MNWGSLRVFYVNLRMDLPKTLHSPRRLENVIYLSLWLLVIAVWIIDSVRSHKLSGYL